MLPGFRAMWQIECAMNSLHGARPQLMKSIGYGTLDGHGRQRALQTIGGLREQTLQLLYGLDSLADLLSSDG